MKDSVYNAIILYLIVVIGIILVKHPLFFSNGYELIYEKSRILYKL